METIDNANYADLTENDLDILLGTALLQNSLGSKAMSDDEKRKVAQNWFRASMPTFASLLCEQGSVVNFLAGPERKERNELIANIAEILLKASGIDSSIIPVTAVAAKIWHYGVGQICSGG